LPQPHLDLSSGERLGELIGRPTERALGRNGQALPGIAEIAPHQPCLVIPAQPAEAQRLLNATIDENRNLTAHVRELEAEVRGSSAEIAKLRRELRGAVHDALTDPLTGLANRRSFDLKLEAVGAGASRSSPAQLIMADIDHFKRVNDAHGHDIGDEVLRIVAEVLLANVRRDSLVARLGGDEFGLLLPRASPHYTAGIAIRLCELLASRPLVVREVIERITLSIASTSPVIVLCLRSPLRADTTSARSPGGPHSGGSRHTAWAAMDGLAAQADVRSKRRCQTNRG
jgi:diguanylate cyclase (GGDEF)-like protein